MNGTILLLFLKVMVFRKKTFTFTCGVTTPWSRVLPDKLKRPKLLKKFPHFMETQGSSPHSQEPTTCPYPDPD
jgi:hypothetical protein